MVYITIPEKCDFNTKFSTWIIVYCVDTNSWFCTNQRFFYYEYLAEFKCEDDAVNYFKNHIHEFVKLNLKMFPNKIDSVFLENTRQEYN